MISYFEESDKTSSVEPLYELAKSLSDRPVLAKFFANLVKRQTDDPDLKVKIKKKFIDSN